MLTVIRLRLRLLLAAAAGVVFYLLLPDHLSVTTRLLMAWDANAIVYLALAVIMFVNSDITTLRQRAEAQDESAPAFLTLTVATSVASLAAIAAELAGEPGGVPGGHAGQFALAIITILCSWLLLHTLFAVHYAHEHYSSRHGGGGLRFPGESEPDYWDFLYFAANLGVAAQTSDVSIRSRTIRRIALVHTVLSFLFNTSILALAINIGAGLL